MNSPPLSLGTLLIACFVVCHYQCQAADTDNLHDTCPTDTTQKTVFINGFPCKNPGSVSASDFKSSLLNDKGDTDDIFRSSTTLVTAAEYPGLNTLSLSVARTDLEVDGLVMPHAHPRASEMLFVSTGVVIAGFFDTNNVMFRKVLREGDVFVFPRGLLHYCLNNGFEDATVFSVLNSQNPGLASIPGAVFAPDDSESMEKLKQRLISVSRLDYERLENTTFF
ncbi:germin-like protein subfamily 3 member 4 [Coffea eugenioides]|uniref:germin-like protein subfamily 3 member 4 n=1 Tax=Coffea eugenioides TaxID=49369 RepID=UPI000F6106CC|nr:germin-like protein subfamily 3 member 4 [Coffea eugenioides]